MVKSYQMLGSLFHTDFNVFLAFFAIKSIFMRFQGPLNLLRGIDYFKFSSVVRLFYLISIAEAPREKREKRRQLAWTQDVCLRGGQPIESKGWTQTRSQEIICHRNFLLLQQIKAIQNGNSLGNMGSAQKFGGGVQNKKFKNNKLKTLPGVVRSSLRLLKNSIIDCKQQTAEIKPVSRFGQVWRGMARSQHLIWLFQLQPFRKMSFEVRQFDVEEKKGEWLWKFVLGKNSASEVDFYREEESTRSLYHLTQDISHQIETAVDRKKKKSVCRDRAIRKLCEKMVKSLNLTLPEFGRDIGEDAHSVSSYFHKGDLAQQQRLQIQGKCQKWIIETWMSLPPESFYKSSMKYLDSLYKDGKKMTTDFELLNQFYLVIEGDGFQPQELTASVKNDSLVLIDINLNIGDKYISQSFQWNPEDNTPHRVNTFIEHFLTDILFDQGISVSKQTMQQLTDQCRVQLRSQALYKSLLKKHANILLNFSTIQISQDMKEYLTEIELKLVDEFGEIFFEDSFEWDLMNEYSNVQQFCRNLMEDEKIPSRYFAELCYKIRSQINAELQWKFTMLVKTFRSIHKDRESPKLNTQTLTQLKKNIIYSMDVSLPNNPDKTKILSNVYLNNSDLFSTLSRNYDILPEEFQQILQCKQTYKASDMAIGDRLITKEMAEQGLKKNNLKLEDNKYLGNFTNNYKMHNIWRQELDNEAARQKP